MSSLRRRAGKRKFWYVRLTCEVAPMGGSIKEELHFTEIPVFPFPYAGW